MCIKASLVVCKVSFYMFDSILLFRFTHKEAVFGTAIPTSVLTKGKNFVKDKLICTWVHQLCIIY